MKTLGRFLYIGEKPMVSISEHNIVFVFFSITVLLLWLFAFDGNLFTVFYLFSLLLTNCSFFIIAEALNNKNELCLPSSVPLKYSIPVNGLYNVLLKALTCKEHVVGMYWFP